MGNEVVKSESTAVVGLAGLAKGLKRSKTTRPTYGPRGYLKMGKDGIWALGRGGDGLNGDRVIFNPMTLMEGFAEVESTQKVYKVHSEEMMLVTEGSVEYDDLPDTPYDWRFARQIQGRILVGNRENFTYSTHSYGGLKAMEVVTDLIEERLASGETVYLFPVVELQSDHYDHTEWGKTYEPVLDVVAWADADGVIEGAEKAKPKPKKVEKEEAPEEPEVEEEEEVEAETEDQSDDTEAEAPADEPPVRRRRRR